MKRAYGLVDEMRGDLVPHHNVASHCRPLPTFVWLSAQGRVSGYTTRVSLGSEPGRKFGVQGGRWSWSLYLGEGTLTGPGPCIWARGHLLYLGLAAALPVWLGSRIMRE